ncbi:ExbD/TolR family protein [Ketobacter sp.]|uniref:ExbD/TolR family protein n=1 Tax=Ketobacter sp. TaxID=2083498 RepID=UPI000F2922CC|nr:biopolymer transporter ExbD [Ketobacter sp.]RLU00621.1 MAG: biopolymer transporter ExbD [Ketobacter sp.]
MSAPLLPPRRSTSLDDRLIPLINIVFLLLIFFLIAGQVTQQQNTRIQAPQSVAEPTLRNPQWLLEVDAKRQLRLNGEAVALDALTTHLMAMSGSSRPAVASDPSTRATPAPTRKLAIKLDRSLQAGDMDEVLQAVRSAGALTVTLLTVPVANSAPGPAQP